METLRDQGSVAQFFDGAIILVTGGTGFLGKALLEKLLRCCPGIDTVYVLLRPKKGLTVEQRYKELVGNQVFDRIRARWPERLYKLTAVMGDMGAPDLGIEQHERHLLRAVTVIFHSAATIRFDETLPTATNQNMQATASVCQLARTMTNLKAFVHVSTAYSNAPQPHIEERVYAPPYDPELILSCAKMLPEDKMDAITSTLLGQHPNTYTLTKALAESIVHSHKDLPVCIVRPSIVTAALHDPFPGWVDNLSGATGIMLAISRGVFRTGICAPETVADLVPVDVVVNSCILAAWRQGTDSPGHCPVYNVTSGSINPITWANLFVYSLKWSRQNPTKHVLWYPNFAITESLMLHRFWDTTCHVLPAFAWDLVLRTQGRKPVMMQLLSRARTTAATCTYFTGNQWKFEVSDFKTLHLASLTARDGSVFPIWPGSIGWEEYIGVYMLGIRRFVLKDGAETLPEARSKLNRLFWMNKSLQAAAWLVVFRLVSARLRKRNIRFLSLLKD